MLDTEVIKVNIYRDILIVKIVHCNLSQEGQKKRLYHDRLV